ncbi:MAG TPA: hypothetical protein VH062_30540 [Polyangiaceae bacterium]|jgi:hypothetical protein|nr:hypothetical protein [Polyangiaceae bacterium]
MAEKKKRKTPRERIERRFVPEATHTSRLAAGLGMAGSLMLGAGVYGQWVKETPVSYAAILVTLGAAGLGGGLWLGSASTFPVRVGDAGVAIERGSETNRILWCDMSEIKLEKGDLVVRSPSLTLTIPIGAHPRAVAYIIAEGERRLPKVVKVDEAGKRSIPLATQPGGEEVPVLGDQVAGRRCAATDKIISFERDARLCPNCAQVYHKDHVPKQCVTCGVDVAGRAVQA